MSAIQQTLLAYGASAPLVVSDVFSANVYTGNLSSQVINNGIDIAGKGGMVWAKRRISSPAKIVDTNRGVIAELTPSSTEAQANNGNFESFNSTGFTLAAGTTLNGSGDSGVAWTFRKAPRFFDVVTYTGDGSGSRSIAHSLGCQPGMVVVKNMGSSAAHWVVRSYGTETGNFFPTGYWSSRLSGTMGFSNTGLVRTSLTGWTSGFFVGAGLSPDDSNLSGNNYVAYLFAHDPSADGVIQCGSYIGNGSATGPTVTLGWEPQFLMVKNATDTGDWVMYDSARDATNPRTAVLLANSTASESTTGPDIDFIATGFQVKSTAANVNTSASTYIYMAIRKP